MFPGATRRQQEAALQSSKAFAVNQQLLDQWTRRLLDEEERARFYAFLNEYQSTRQVHVFVYRCAQLLSSPQKRYLMAPVRNVISPLDRAKFDKRAQEYGLIPTTGIPRVTSPARPHSTPPNVISRSTTPTSTEDFASSWPTSGFSTIPRRRPVSVSSERDRDAVRKLLIRRSSESEELGFSFRGGAEHRIGLYVSSVEDGTVAHKSGLKPGMQLLKANDVSLEGVTSQEATRILKGAKKIKLCVVDRGMYPGTYSGHTQYRWMDPAGRPVSPPPEPRDTDSRMSEGQPGGKSEMRLLSNSDERKVNVIVKNHQKLGISIRGGIDQGVGIYVSHVNENSVAEQAGLRAGDQILDINGESFLEVTHAEATSMLKSQDLMVMTIKDVGKIPHSTVTYDRAKWVSCSDKQTDEMALKQKSATLPARFRHKGGAPAQQPSPFFKEQPSADFSTFKPSDDSDENRRQSTVFKHGMGTQMVMKSTQVSTARAEVNEKAQSILTEHEFSSLNYYLSQYQDNHVGVDDLVRALITILDTVEKAALLTEIRQIVPPRDVDRFESLTREKEMEVLRERQRSELNRLKASAVITDSPPVKRQAVPGSSQVDVRQSPLVQRTALFPGSGSYSSQDEDETDFSRNPLVHQVATVAVVHNALNRQLVRGEPQEEEESEDGDTGPHVAADAMSDVSDTAVLVAVNAIAEAVDETDKRESDEEKEEANETTDYRREERTREIEDKRREETNTTHEIKGERRDDKKYERQDEKQENEESTKPRESESIPIQGGAIVTEESEEEEPAVFHVPPPPDRDEDSESEDEEERQKKEEETTVKADVIHPQTESIEHQSPLTRSPPIFMAPPPPPPPPNEQASMPPSPPVFHVPPPPPESYYESSDEEEMTTHTEQQEHETTEDQLDEQNEIISPDQQRVIEEKMQQRRKRINPSSVYVRNPGSRTSLDSTMTDISVDVDETWDQSLQDGPMHGHPATSTPRKHILDNVLLEQQIPDEKQEITAMQSMRETATDEGELVHEKTELKDVEMERDQAGAHVEETAPVVAERAETVSVEVREVVHSQTPEDVQPVVSQLEVHVSSGYREEQQLVVSRDDNQNAPDTLLQMKQPEPEQVATHQEPTHLERKEQENLTETAAPDLATAPATTKPEDIYAVPNKVKKCQTPHKVEQKSEPKTVAGFTGLTGGIVNVLVPKNKPRLGMSVNGGSNTKQKEVRIRDIQKNGCAAAVMPPLKLGQQILSVDRHSLKGLTHRQSVELIKESFSSRRTEMELTVHEDDEVKKVAAQN